MINGMEKKGGASEVHDQVHDYYSAHQPQQAATNMSYVRVGRWVSTSVPTESARSCCTVPCIEA